MTYIIATFIGFTIVTSMVQNARLAKDITNTQTTVLNFITGLGGISIVFLISGAGLTSFALINDVPLFGYIGGILGVIVVFTSTVIIRKVSIIASSMLMYTGQMLAGFVIDYFRGIELSPIKLIGCALIIAGIYFNAYIDSTKSKAYQVEHKAKIARRAQRV